MYIEDKKAHKSKPTNIYELQKHRRNPSLKHIITPDINNLKLKLNEIFLLLDSLVFTRSTVASENIVSMGDKAWAKSRKSSSDIFLVWHVQKLKN